MNSKFKAGDRVSILPGFGDDSGVVVSVRDASSGTDSIFASYSANSVWVKWDSDGMILHIHQDEIKLLSSESGNLTEEAAVMLLLAKG